jgi:hypothetical protein
MNELELRKQMLGIYKHCSKDVLQSTLDTARKNVTRLLDHKETEERTKELNYNYRIIDVCLELLG